MEREFDKIYVDFEIPKTLSKFLKLFFSHKEGIMYRGVQTYSDKRCTEIQCRAGKFRSFDDLYDCVNTYFPKVERKEVIHELLILDFGKILDTKIHFRMYNCTDIYKPTMGYTIYETDKEYFNKLISENGDDDDYDDDLYYNTSEYGWKDLLELVGITSFTKYKNYIKRHTNKDIKKKAVKKSLFTYQ